MSVFDYDDDEEELVLAEDPWIKVYGSGTGDYYTNKTISESFDKNNKHFFEIKNPITGEYTAFSYQDNPLGMVLAPIGYASDLIRTLNAKKKAKGEGSRLPKVDIGAIMAKSIFSQAHFALGQSYSQGLKDISSLANADNKRWAETAAGILTRPVKSLYNTNFYSQLYKFYNAMAENPLKKTNYKTTKGLLTGKLAKNTMLLDWIIENEDKDAFGYEILGDKTLPLIPDVVIESFVDNVNYRKDKPEWQILWEYPSVYKDMRINVDPWLGGYKLTESDVEEYKDIHRWRFQDNFWKEFDKVNNRDRGISDIDVYDILTKAKTKANKESKKEMKKNLGIK
jgi:hypothetical protein